MAWTDRNTTFRIARSAVRIVSLPAIWPNPTAAIQEKPGAPSQAATNPEIRRARDDAPQQPPSHRSPQPKPQQTRAGAFKAPKQAFETVSWFPEFHDPVSDENTSLELTQGTATHAWTWCRSEYAQTPIMALCLANNMLLATKTHDHETLTTTRASHNAHAPRSA
jgi:hypothetical protein